MRKILLLIFGFYSLGYSQVISDAEILLNKVSDNIKSYDNIYINYAYTLKNLEEDINQTNNGSFVTENDKDSVIKLLLLIAVLECVNKILWYFKNIIYGQTVISNINSRGAIFSYGFLVLSIYTLL